jgi:hypothetical protein
MQLPDNDALTTILGHTSGQFIGCTQKIIVKEANDPQKYKSAVTYMRRTQWESILGVGTEDDDGNEASHTPPQTPPPKKVLPAAEKRKAFIDMCNKVVKTDKEREMAIDMLGRDFGCDSLEQVKEADMNAVYKAIKELLKEQV